MVISYETNPPADETQSRPLKEYLIKFSVINGKNPLTLDFKTFTTSTGLDYNNVLGGNYSSNEQINSIQQMIAYCLITRTKVDFGEIIYNDLVTKLIAPMIAMNNQKDSMSPLPFSGKKKKVKSHTVTPTLPKSQGHEASGALSKKRQNPKSKKTPIETQVTLPTGLMEGSKQSYLVSSSNILDPQDLERNIQLAGLPSTASDEGTVKTMSLPERPRRDKDLEGFKPPADMEPLTNHVTDLSGTGPKYQLYYSLMMKWFKKVMKMMCWRLESDFNSSCPVVLKKYDNILPLTERQLVKCLQKLSRAIYDRISADYWDKHEEAAASYADLKAYVEEYYDENVDHKDQTAKLVKETMKTLDNICKASIDERAKLLKALNRVSETLKADSALKKEMKKIDQSYNTTFGNLLGLTEIINNAKLLKLLTKLEGFQSTLNTLSTQCASISKSLKEDPEFNQRLLQAAEGYIQNSSRLTEISNSLQTINFPSLHQRISNIENTQVTMQSDISSIKGIVTKMLQVFKGMSSSTPLDNASIPTALQPKVRASGGRI
ncbi:hypothetical protein Tco_0073382 [Tanacetum coccineum]